MYAICGSIEARRILSIMRQMNPSIWLGIPAIPIAMLVNKLSFMPVYFPLVPLAITGYNTSTLACPPSKALTLASIPLISSVYRLLWVKTLGNLQLKWDGQFQKSKAAGIALRDPNNLDDHDDDDEVAQIEIGVNEGDAPEDNPDRDNDGQGAGLRWNIVVSLEGVIREFIWTLLTPTLGSVCGSILGMSPRIAGLFPQKFHRSIIGAFTAVVLRDLMKFWYSYLTYYVRKSRRIA
ncbi:hypothetical protein H4219_000739 [Mycoemilia scoparia]|uniref:Uncharacterized protein n=1 Tax=Mycoemilia scoparia TaxID=417184 RepID=A0A9W8DWD5_9FUNG|nr:hypothetical protein H4219_000739 [Mycoemilia scoparia]